MVGLRVFTSSIQVRFLTKANMLLALKLVVKFFSYVPRKWTIFVVGSFTLIGMFALLYIHYIKFHNTHLGNRQRLYHAHFWYTNEDIISKINFFREYYLAQPALTPRLVAMNQEHNLNNLNNYIRFCTDLNVQYTDFNAFVEQMEIFYHDLYFRSRFYNLNYNTDMYKTINFVMDYLDNNLDLNTTATQKYNFKKINPKIITHSFFLLPSFVFFFISFLPI